MKTEENGGIPILTELLLAWYDRHHRILPWRSDPTPYHVWVSEIMLQQTRVEAVIPYYNRFIQELPDIEALAEVPDETLMKLWQGLGYYSRGRNLKKAAGMVAGQYQGRMPSKPEELIKLPGIGPYTAGAISSIAFGETATLMDGNVIRVMTRVMGIQRDSRVKETQSEIRGVLLDIIPKKRPGDFNQALMELGAIRCIPNGAPLCGDCPLFQICEANRRDLTEEIPMKAPKKPRTVEDKTLLFLEYKGMLGIRKRPPGGLLGGMWEFPSLGGDKSGQEVHEALGALGYAPVSIKALGGRRHVFTHREWNMTGYRVELSRETGDWDLTFFPKTTIFKDIPFPKAFLLYMDTLDATSSSGENERRRGLK